MPVLPTKSFNQIVTNTISGIQGRASKLINFSIGSTLRAVVEGYAGLFLWFQALVLQLLTATRLSTSSGTDVDTFTVDFMPPIAGSQTATLPNGSPRLGAQAASGIATYSRFTAASVTCFIPVGATLTTTDGNQTQFVVTADPTFGTYQLGPPDGYLLASNVASIDVPVEAVVPGTTGNIALGALSVMTSPITGIDTVINNAKFFNGADFESDNSLKSRFSAYILGLSRGDYFGLASSILGVGETVQWTLTEGYNFDGSYHPGFFFVVADDGSGAPSPAFLALVAAAAQAVRPLSVQCSVYPPVRLTANVSMQLTTLTGYDHNTVVAQVAALVTFNINSLGLGVPLSPNQVAAWAYSIPGVTPGIGVKNVQINGATGDAATIFTTKLTQDGKYTINYISIKSGVMNIS